ncbi:MAG: Tol-Pal system subunit TolQ [Halobacteriovorax sp.]|nr:Tol-Pal system subunit TolQ [Halobacteriovorax sp.]
MSAGGNLDIVQILWDSSAVVKLDLGLLVLASVVSWGIIIKKKLQFNKLQKLNTDFQDVFEGSPTLKETHDVTREVELGPYKAVFDDGYEEFLKIRDTYNGDLHKVREYLKDFGAESFERAMRNGMVSEEEKMSEGLTTLASIGSITPFVGLFGTVWGIIDAFAGLAAGGATLETVAPGIAEALVATAIGLVAAIPAVWYFNKFNSIKHHINENVISFSEKFINQVQRTISARIDI